MVKVYHDLQRTTNVVVLRQGTILMIAPADGYNPAEVHPVRMNEVQWGTRRSFEFPLLLEALVESDMLDITGMETLLNRTTRSMRSPCRQLSILWIK